MPPRSIIYYVSGHGFGHATRSAEIIAALNSLAPAVPIFVQTAAPAMIFEEADCRCTIEPVSLDVGVVQTDSLTMDIPSTIDACQSLLRNLPGIVRTEIEIARARNAGLIVSDVAAAPFRISNSLGIPGIAISNFSWDWIYDSWREAYPEIEPIRDAFAADYALCDKLFLLPFSEPLPAFHSTQPMPLIGRKATLDRSTVRTRLGIDPSVPAVLLSFGGMGLQNGQLRQLESLHPDFLLIAVGDHRIPGLNLTRPALRASGIRYPDLVAACDVVVTKPGYGIVAECAVNRIRMLYTDRGPFREYDVLVAQMGDYIPAEYIDRPAFEAGRWRPSLTRLLERRLPPDPLLPDGARSVARGLLDRMEIST